MLAKEFHSVCALSSPSEYIFSSGRGKLSTITIPILMTLKSWGETDKADIDEEEFGEDRN